MRKLRQVVAERYFKKQNWITIKNLTNFVKNRLYFSYKICQRIKKNLNDDESK